MSAYTTCMMPDRAPLEMAAQDFADRPTPRRRFRASLSDRLWRFAAFAPAVAVTIMLILGFVEWFRSGGVTALETSAIALIGVTFIWVSLSVSTVIVGLLRLAISPRRLHETHGSEAKQNVALLVPVYNESPADVFGNIQATLKELAQRGGDDRYSAFILSDSFEPETIYQEEQAFLALRAHCPPNIEVYYRHRAKNTDKKVGNLSDWLENWGGAYDAMVVLDADSLMSGAAIRHLTRALANDPDAGLVQSYPLVIGAETLFGRIQQFSNAVYGWLLAEGLAVWSQREGNYWGHNAIIRTRAFADSARLPYLRGRGGRSKLILSHDFVEAGMLRRAGWTVRFLPNAGGSYEEAPQTLIDYVLRDRRWCRGNLQHLRLLGVRGFHPITRFHLFQGAIAYLLSPAWLTLIAIWAIIGRSGLETTSYFSSTNPLYPIWPENTQMGGWGYLLFIYAMLLVPKITGMIALAMNRQNREIYGGLRRLISSVLFEITCSILYAPILMVQQSLAVFRALIGRDQSWTPQSRSMARYSWGMMLRFHIVESALGFAMSVAIVFGVISLWLAPIALSLIMAVPLSRLSALRVSDGRFPALRLDTPHSLKEPRIITAAREERVALKAHLESGPVATAAE
ncbi:glucans biosynthesis glucosyltransferase MdoH [Roseovarius sp. 2305UL8-3]|uniref:glucans biosynthesis glucosyltransferase MdoH n=1 Tax=Roseovarius conchicola TaxID=3121636 RepID=UPI0035271CB5